MTIQEKIESLKELIEYSFKEALEKHPNAKKEEVAFANSVVAEMLALSYQFELRASSVLKNSFGIELPEEMKEEVQKLVFDSVGDKYTELTPKDIYRMFVETYVKPTPVYHISQCNFVQEEGISTKVAITQGKDTKTILAYGNGRVDAVSDAIKVYFDVEYDIVKWEQHAISKGSTSKVATFVLVASQSDVFWGVGIDEDLVKASIAALVSATNKLLVNRQITEPREDRMIDICNYVQQHYKTVTMNDLENEFHLSIPYLSKYIKTQTGLTFQELVKEVRMKRAKILLKETMQTVKSIALASGYDNVEHFNRLFKKTYGITPIQYRGEDNE